MLVSPRGFGSWFSPQELRFGAGFAADIGKADVFAGAQRFCRPLCSAGDALEMLKLGATAAGLATLSFLPSLSTLFPFPSAGPTPQPPFG